MIKRIIFLIQQPFNLRDYERFGIELLRQNGFEVETWNLGPILQSKLLQAYAPPDKLNCDGLSIFNDRLEMYYRLSNLSYSDFVISVLSYDFSTLEIFRALTKSPANYAVSCANALPTPFVEENVFQKSFKRLVSLRHPVVWRQLFMKLPLRYLGVKPASLILAGGEESLTYHYPTSKDSEILRLHTLDYDLYLKEKDVPYVEKPIAVFLDEFIPFHPYYIMSKEDPPIAPDRYYQLLNNFFDLVEGKTGFEVVIAAHPRSNYEERPDYFKGRRHIRGKTISLVKECQLVLNHRSTAINFANLFYKPTIFITCSDFERTYLDYWITEMAKWHGKKSIVMDKDNNIDLKKELTVSKEHYNNYRRAYIKTEESQHLPFWQIVANRLKKVM